MNQNNQAFTAKSIKQYFSSSSKIFKSHKMKREYFDNDLSFLPKNLEEIIHRQEQINQLMDVFGDIKDGSKANARCYGPSGTGKTLTIKWLTRLVLEKLKDENKGDHLFSVYINCALDKSSIVDIIHQLITKYPENVQKGVANELNFTYPIPNRGLRLGNYLTIFRECFFSYNKQILIVLDEFDKIAGFKSQEMSEDATKLIYFLMELGQGDLYSEKSVESRPINLIIISNSNQRVQELIAPHARGRLTGPSVHFTTYSEDELVGVLETRKPAFEENAIGNTVIREIAEYVANAEGHARVAINVLGLSGSIASRKGESSVTIEHVHEAMKLREEKLISEELLALNFDHTLVFLSIYALSHICQEDGNRELLPFNTVYNVYKIIFKNVQESNPSEKITLKSSKQVGRYLVDQLEEERLCIIQGARPKYYGIPQDYSTGTIQEILLDDHPIIKNFSHLNEVIQFQIPEICEVFRNYQAKRATPRYYHASIN
ncbi:MAG: AAA family ATPase [Bacteroidetes bacterium]|nr:AAA family ATPase [Bacteroidota bacterium]